MNIDDIIKLKESGFTIEEINQLMNTANPPLEKKVEESKESEKALENQEKVLDNQETKSGGVELNVFEEMMSQFKDSMNQQMEAFKQTIQLSNMNQNIGNVEENDSRKIAEEFTAKIINPRYKK